MNIVTNLEFRIEILRLLVAQYHDLKEPDYDSVCQCFIHLNDPSSCAVMLKDLVAKDEVRVAFFPNDQATPSSCYADCL
jgi:26S proteasome regulatory subunit N2